MWTRKSEANSPSPLRGGEVKTSQIFFRTPAAFHPAPKRAFGPSRCRHEAVVGVIGNIRICICRFRPPKHHLFRRKSSCVASGLSGTDLKLRHLRGGCGDSQTATPPVRQSASDERRHVDARSSRVLGVAKDHAESVGAGAVLCRCKGGWCWCLVLWRHRVTSA